MQREEPQLYFLQDVYKRQEQFYALKKQVDAVDDELDKLDDEFEYAYQMKEISFEIYKARERAIEKRCV